MTSPSMHAVLRPALPSVTRRTLTSVLARDRSINFCKLRTFFRSPALLAVSKYSVTLWGGCGRRGPGFARRVRRGAW